MKRVFLSISTLFSFVICVNAQNSSPLWSLSGNSNVSASSKFGTTNNYSLRIYTNNKQRMIINSDKGLVGIGTSSPTARLQVNSASNTNVFRAQVNGNTKLLVHGQGGVSIGANTTPPANGLYVAGNVGIGTTKPAGKLEVVGSKTEGYGILTSGYDIGLQATSNYTFGNGIVGYSFLGSGVYGTSSYMGVKGFSDGDADSYGTWGETYYGTGAGGASHNGTGVDAYSVDGLGGYFSSTNSYGLISRTTNGNYAGVFYGNVYASGIFQTSDKNLKKNIQQLENAMSIINKLKPQYYEFKKEAKYASLNLPKGNHYGLFAQDLEKILPSLVSESSHELKLVEAKTALNPSSNGKTSLSVAGAKERFIIKAVNYTELIPIVIKGMQELAKANQDLENQVNEFKTLLQNTSKGESNIVITPSAFLKQNKPNPATGNTVISYFTPLSTRNAEILITDIYGNVVKSYTVTRGYGQVNIKSEELHSGTYNYTLYANNIKTDTKQMIIIK